MIEEKFAAGHSVIHRLDPRLKIVVATVYSFVVALSERFPSLLAALAVAAALVALARLDLREVLRRLLPVNVLVLLLWIFMPLTFEGEPLFLIGPFPVSGAGAELAARITLKANAILPALMALVASESVAVLGHALDRLGAPPKMVHLLLLTYRYVFVLEQEYRRLATAMKLRCFRPGTNMHTYRTYAYLVGMLFVRASARAERVHQAMLCRGFKGRFYSLQSFSFSRLDWASAVFLGGTLAGLGFVEWGAGM